MSSQNENLAEKSKFWSPTNPTLLFTIGAFLGSLSCFSRADFNLPMFAFLAVMWSDTDVSDS